MLTTASPVRGDPAADLAAVGARRSFATQLKSDEITWGEMQDSVTYFAKQWRTRLDKGRNTTSG